MNRIHLLNPGQALDAGDRRLTGFRPHLDGQVQGP